MHTVKAAEPESIRRWLEGLACINSKKWDKGVSTCSCCYIDKKGIRRLFDLKRYHRGRDIRPEWLRPLEDTALVYLDMKPSTT